MEKFLAILNPKAGGGVARKEASAAIGRFRNAGLSVEVTETRGPGDASRIAREAFRQGERNFIAIGGDGTGFEVVNGLFPAAENKGTRPTLGFVPVGTGNSFLRDFTEQAAAYTMDAILSGKRRACDVLRLTHKNGTLHFINILSLGFAAEAAALRNRLFTGFGELGYIFAVFSKVAFLQPRPIPIRVDGGAEERDPVTFISVSNTRFTGGKMMMAPKADPCDGYADLIRVGPMGRLELLRAFPRIFKGTHLELPQVTSRRVQTIEFHLDREVDVQIDGETMKLQPERVDVLPGALEVRL